MGLMGSLLLSTCTPWHVCSTERVEVKIDGVVLPVSVEEHGTFVRSPTADPAQLSRSELSTWMGLLAPESREGLIRLLQAPVLSRRSLGRWPRQMPWPTTTPKKRRASYTEGL